MRIQAKEEGCLSYVAFNGGMGTWRVRCIEGDVLYALHRGARKVLKLSTMSKTLNVFYLFYSIYVFHDHLIESRLCSREQRSFLCSD